MPKSRPVHPRRTPESGEDDPNLEYTKKATDLAIEYLKDQLAKGKPDQKLLDELKWTPDDMRRFVDQWDRFKKQADAADPATKKKLEEKMKSLGLRPHGTTLKGGQTHEGPLSRGPRIAPQRTAARNTPISIGRIPPGRPRVPGPTVSNGATTVSRSAELRSWVPCFYAAGI